MMSIISPLIIRRWPDRCYGVLTPFEHLERHIHFGSGGSPLGRRPEGGKQLKLPRQGTLLDFWAGPRGNPVRDQPFHRPRPLVHIAGALKFPSRSTARSAMVSPVK